jgi:hypothetical protein
VKGREDQLCLIQRSLYCLKQSPRKWNKRFNDHVVLNGFTKSPYDPCVYHSEYEVGEFVYQLLLVDDILLACKSKSVIQETKNMLISLFEMNKLGEARKILGMEIWRDRSLKTLKLNQSSHIQKVLATYNMQGCKLVKTPYAPHFKLSLRDCPSSPEEEKYMQFVPYANAVGSLMYLIVCSRPGISYGVSMVSRFLPCPGKAHREAVKWLLRYLSGTQDVGIIFSPSQEEVSTVASYVDSNYANDLDKGRSITGYVFKVIGKVVSRKATLQHVVALSSSEAKYMALVEAVKESLWLKGFVRELGFDVSNTNVLCDNKETIQLSKNSVLHERTKHINVRLHYI